MSSSPPIDPDELVLELENFQVDQPILRAFLAQEDVTDSLCYLEEMLEDDDCKERVDTLDLQELQGYLLTLLGLYNRDKEREYLLLFIRCLPYYIHQLEKQIGAQVFAGIAPHALVNALPERYEDELQLRMQALVDKTKSPMLTLADELAHIKRLLVEPPLDALAHALDSWYECSSPSLSDFVLVLRGISRLLDMQEIDAICLICDKILANNDNANTMGHIIHELKQPLEGSLRTLYVKVLKHPKFSKVVHLTTYELLVIQKKFALAAQIAHVLPLHHIEIMVEEIEKKPAEYVEDLKAIVAAQWEEGFAAESLLARIAFINSKK